MSQEDKLKETGKEVARGAAIGGTMGAATSLALGGIGVSGLGTAIGIGLLSATGIGLGIGAGIAGGMLLSKKLWK